MSVSEKIYIPENAKIIMGILSENDCEAYLVGGFVRDCLLGRETNDCDICTDALPNEVSDILRNNGIKVFETGIKHGTVTAVLNGENIEITTYRQDGEYTDNRHPDSVSFVRDLESDLSRRDFTVNAFAYNGTLVDFYNGINDLENRVIRCVGNPDKRFEEDALRILRAIRFSSVLNFEIEEETKKSVFKNYRLLKNVSKERIFCELSKLLLGDNVLNVLLEYRPIFAYLCKDFENCFDFPQKNPWHIYDVYTHICKTVENSPKDLIIRLTMFFHDIAKPPCVSYDENGTAHFYKHPYYSYKIAEKFFEEYKVSNEIKNSVCTLIKYHDAFILPNKNSVRKWFSKIGVDLTRKLVYVKLADLKSQNLEKTSAEIVEAEKVFNTIDSVLADEDCFKLSQLAVNGFDLIKLGYSGKEIGTVLNKLLEFVIEGGKNDKNILLKYLSDIEKK